jgi:hypothetical protein
MVDRVIRGDEELSEVKMKAMMTRTSMVPTSIQIEREAIYNEVNGISPLLGT